MISLYDELLTEEDKKEIMERDEDIKFATIAYNQDGQLLVDLDTKKEVSADVPGM